jgi:hypothetical protein
MKTRLGFVSNSSSTSFYIDSSIYTKQQVVDAIENMIAEGLFAQYTVYQSNQKELSKQYKDYHDIRDEVINNSIPYNCIVVDSQSDNSIDYEIQEMLEIRFNAYRQHWG